MKDKELNLFVPGRLCLLGEHSDWAGRYRTINSNINKGYAIVTGIEEGIYANVKPNKILVINDNEKNKTFSCKMNKEELRKIASEGSYWSYCAGVALAVKEHYNVQGLEINITKTTIPVKKGLSSSAAICVLVARAFNQVYNLHLNTLGEMNLAYNGELETPSRCGRLDQACAFGKNPILMEFDGDKINIKNLKLGSDFYFVFADLMKKKDTIKILSDLNKCYPFPNDEISENVIKCLGEINENNIKEAIKYLELGDNKKFGELMIKAQKDFDLYIKPASETELSSPTLHKMFEDKKVHELCYGYKGVGSQGDGTIQFLAKNKEAQLELVKYLHEELKMDAYTLELNKVKHIKKAIIPLAGNGTRMYPITKILKKAFLPIIDKDGIVKPVIMSLLEELDEAGIEDIYLVIDKNDQKDYDNFFKKELSTEISSKLSKEALEYENKIIRIGLKLKYVYQKEKLGLGHAVSLCKNFIGNESFLLVLGDQIYKTNNKKTVTRQVLDSYEKTGKMTISVYNVPLQDVSKYGILTGKIEKENDYFLVDKMTEKPEQTYAEEYLYTLNKNKKEYYAVFGEYVLPSEIFKVLEKNIKEGKKDKNEYQLTPAIDYLRSKSEMIAFIPEGKMLDVGNVPAYKNTLIEKMK